MSCYRLSSKMCRSVARVFALVTNFSQSACSCSGGGDLSLIGQFVAIAIIFWTSGVSSACCNRSSHPDRYMLKVGLNDQGSPNVKDNEPC